MSRRGVALVVGVVLAIGLGAWWLSALPVEVDPAPPPAVAERVEGPAPPPPIQPIAPEPEPEPVLVAQPSAPLEVDAGLMADVEIEVFKGGKQLIGVRIELDGPGGRVSRPTDVMGYARFTLPVGKWRVVDPQLRLDRANDLVLDVTPPLSRFRVDLPMEWTLRGRVVDNQMRPVPGARVSYPFFTYTEEITTDPGGEFAIRTTEPSLQVQAKRGTSRSLMRMAGPGEPITLVLEEWTQLKVEVTNKRDAQPRIRVLHRNEIVAVGIDDEWLQVPVGHLEVLARAKVWGQMQSGKAQVDTKTGGENRVQIELKPTPPISGVLLDIAGNRMPGLGVAILEVDPTTVMLRGDGGIGAQLASVTTRTNERGEFSWQPRKLSSPDPLYQVAVVELWQAKADPVLVRLDDAPLSIVVEPAPPR